MSLSSPISSWAKTLTSFVWLLRGFICVPSDTQPIWIAPLAHWQPASWMNLLSFHGQEQAISGEGGTCRFLAKWSILFLQKEDFLVNLKRHFVDFCLKNPKHTDLFSLDVCRQPLHTSEKGERNLGTPQADKWEPDTRQNPGWPVVASELNC